MYDNPNMTQTLTLTHTSFRGLGKHATCAISRVADLHGCLFSPAKLLSARLRCATVSKTTGGREELFAIFDPFSPSLWLGIILTFSLMGFLLFALEIVERDGLSALFQWEEVRTHRSRVVLAVRLLVAWLDAMYVAVALLLGGDQMSAATVSRKLLRLSMLFTTLIIVATYTANLASFLTASATQLNGPGANHARSSARARRRIVEE